MEPLKVLVIPASARKASLNRRLAAIAAIQMRVAGIEVSEYDPNELKLPVYDGDLELTAGVPDGAQRLLKAIATCDALLIVTPEYNGFPTPLLINAFDWLSRINAGPSRPAGLAITAGKPVALLSASPGPGGALRSMNYVRQYLQMAFQMLVVPQQFALGRAHEAFDESGALHDAKASQAVAGVLGALTTLARAVSASRAGPTSRS